MKWSREGRREGLWSLVFAGGFGIETFALPVCVFECGGGGKYVVQGCWWGFRGLLAGLGLRVPVIIPLSHWVLLGGGGGGVWLQISDPARLHPFASFSGSLVSGAGIYWISVSFIGGWAS